LEKLDNRDYILFYKKYILNQGWNDLNQLIKISDLNPEFD